MLITMMPPGLLRPYGNNPRKNQKAIEKVAASIRNFGFRQPIVADRERVIIIGHTRHEAAKFLRLPVVPVHIAEDLPPEKIKALRIADNKLAELAEWDKDLLAHEINALGDAFDMTDYGFTSKELDRLLDGAGLGDLAATPGAVQAIPTVHQVVVECTDETQQRAVYERLTGEGLRCSVMTM